MKKSLESKLSEFEMSKEDIDYCVDLYRSLPNGVLDKSFIEKITTNDLDSLSHRLSELFVSNLFYEKYQSLLSGLDNGPDLILNIDSRRVNIEIITPCLVENTKSNIAVFEDGNKIRSKPIDVVEINSFKLRISSSFRTKLSQFEKWKVKNIVSSDDINLILINIGFMENILHGNIEELRHVFYKETTIVLHRDEQGVHVEFVEFDTHAKKQSHGDEEEKLLTQSYFESNQFETDIISGVIVTDINNLINKRTYGYNGIIFKNSCNTDSTDAILDSLNLPFKIYEHPDKYFMEQIKNNSGMLGWK